MTERQLPVAAPPGVHDFPPPSGEHAGGTLCLFPLPVRLRHHMEEHR